VNNLREKRTSVNQSVNMVVEYLIIGNTNGHRFHWKENALVLVD